jgi:hypothetical protein
LTEAKKRLVEGGLIVKLQTLLENLQDTLDKALEMNRTDARAAATDTYEEVSIVA